MTTADILKDLINADIHSSCKERMNEGVRYYDCKHDILQRDFREYYIDKERFTDYSKSNEHLVNPFHEKLVDQKQGYINGKPVTITSDNEQLEKDINELLGEKFELIMSDIIVNASNKGYEGLEPFIDESGTFDYENVDGRELIFVYDASLQKKLKQVIRYYKMKEGEEERYRVEVWDEEKVTYYMEDKNGDYKIIFPGAYSDIPYNPRFHFYKYDTRIVRNVGELTEENSEGTGWGRIPLIKFANNSKETTDLQKIKSYIDALDVVSSGFLNDLRDIQLAIWVLRGFDGEDLSEFMHNLQQFKAIKLESGNDTNADPKTMEIPKEARSAMMDYLINQIYAMGEGVNMDKLTGGSLTNVVIKAYYTDLDNKANRMIVQLKKSLKDFLWFAVEYLNMGGKNYDVNELKITFNKSALFNTKEIVETLQMSMGMISDDTILANHPMVDNPVEEKKRLEAERPIQITEGE